MPGHSRIQPSSKAEIYVADAYWNKLCSFSMSVWGKSSRKVLDLFLSSTGEKFYVSQICERTDLGRSTLCPLLRKMADVGLLIREEESAFDAPHRAPRVYYSLPIESIEMLRL